MRAEKESMVQELREKTAGADFVLMVDYSGLDVPRAALLRRALGERNVRVQVVRNRLLKRVAAERGWSQLGESLGGPTAMVFGEGDVTEVAKALKRFTAEHEVLAVRSGMLGDDFLSPELVRELGDLPSREVLLGRVVGTVAAPLGRLVGVMQQKILSLLYVLQAVREKKEQE